MPATTRSAAKSPSKGEVLTGKSKVAKGATKTAKGETEGKKALTNLTARYDKADQTEKNRLVAAVEEQRFGSPQQQDESDMMEVDSQVEHPPETSKSGSKNDGTPNEKDSGDKEGKNKGKQAERSTATDGEESVSVPSNDKSKSKGKQVERPSTSNGEGSIFVPSNDTSNNDASEPASETASTAPSTSQNTGTSSRASSEEILTSTESVFDDDDGVIPEEDVTGGELVSFFQGGFGNCYGVYQHGPKRFAKYTIGTVHGDYKDWKKNNPEQAGLDAHIHRAVVGKINGPGGSKTVQPGDIRRILGVAWIPVPDTDRMESLAPSVWVEKGKKRPHALIMVVQVRWFHKDTGPESWESRGNVKKYWPKGSRNKTKTVEDIVEYEGFVIMEKGLRLPFPDWFLINRAVRLEKRHDEFLSGARRDKDRNRDPTPGLPLLSESKPPEADNTFEGASDGEH